MIAGSQGEVLHGNACLAHSPGASVLNVTWIPKHVPLLWETLPIGIAKAGDRGCQIVKQACCAFLKCRRQVEAPRRDSERALRCSA